MGSYYTEAVLAVVIIWGVTESNEKPIRGSQPLDQHLIHMEVWLGEKEEEVTEMER